MPLKKHSVRLFVLLLIFLQLGGGPKVHRDDPMNEFVKNGVNMGYGAAAGAAVYLVSKILGSTVGSSEVAKAIRKNLPFMSAIIPRKGWIGWREEILDLMGMTTLGASVGSYTAGGQLAQQFQFGFSDALSHYFLSTLAEWVRGDKLFTTQPHLLMSLW